MKDNHETLILDITRRINETADDEEKVVEILASVVMNLADDRLGEDPTAVGETVMELLKQLDDV